MRPIIDRKTSCLPVTVSRGENIVITAKFSGDPVPERHWWVYIGYQSLFM